MKSKLFIPEYSVFSHSPKILPFLINGKGIRRGQVVKMPGSLAWVCRFESPLDPQAGWPDRYINVWRCRGLSMVLMQLKEPLELFVKSREFPPGSGFLSRRDMTWAVESDVKPNSYLHQWQREQLKLNCRLHALDVIQTLSCLFHLRLIFLLRRAPHPLAN